MVSDESPETRADKKTRANKTGRNKTGADKTRTGASATAKKGAAGKKAPAKARAGKKARKQQPKLTARTADRHVLYQRSVQAPADDAQFYSRRFKKYTGRDLRVFREDFCGTAVLSCHHVLLHPDNIAIGVDLDQPTLDWGIEHNVNPLLNDEQKKRLKLFNKNVLDVRSPKADAINALNFSYSVFKKRKELGAYLKSCFRALKPGGVMFMDAWGGPDVMQQKTDRIQHKGFVYEWEQRVYDPISHEITCAIHFEFKDGTRMHNAFVYDWRLWTLAEIIELFEEAGFEDTHVLWEGTDHDSGTGNGVFRRRAKGDMDEAWISIVVGRKPQ